MKLIGLLSWYDEHASWLTAAIASHYRAGLTHLIAVDGAYELFPGGRPRSGVEQHHAINDTCEGLGISSLIHTPATTWTGNEVHKRTFLFELGLTIADPDDWFLVIDADHLMTEPDDLPRHLQQTDLHAAEVSLWQRPDPTTNAARQFKMPRVHQSTMRVLYRANPGLHCDGNHYTYTDGQGRILWGQTTPGHTIEPALDLTHIRIEHRTTERDLARHEDQYAYYKRRDNLQIERRSQHCDWKNCTEPQAITVPYDFERVNGTEALQAGHINVCAKHAKRAHYENRAQLAALGMQYGQEGELLTRHT